MATIAEYEYDPAKIGPAELAAAALILVHAKRHKGIVVELRDAGADDYSVGVAAVSQILQQRIGEALRDGRLRIEPAPATTPDDNEETRE